MGELEEQVKTIAREQGAALVGIASHKRLADAPPSGDPGYLLSSAAESLRLRLCNIRLNLNKYQSVDLVLLF